MARTEDIRGHTSRRIEDGCACRLPGPRNRRVRLSRSWKSGASTTPCATTRRSLPRRDGSRWCRTCSGGRNRVSSCPIPTGPLGKGDRSLLRLRLRLGRSGHGGYGRLSADHSRWQWKGRDGRILPGRQDGVPDVLPLRHRLRGRLLRNLYRAFDPERRQTSRGPSCCIRRWPTNGYSRKSAP